MMSRKHYKIIAAAIETARQIGGDKSTLDAVITALCIGFKLDNPAFSSDKFREACKLPKVT